MVFLDSADRPFAPADSATTKGRNLPTRNQDAVHLLAAHGITPSALVDAGALRLIEDPADC